MPMSDYKTLQPQHVGGSVDPDRVRHSMENELGDSFSCPTRVYGIVAVSKHSPEKYQRACPLHFMYFHTRTSTLHAAHTIKRLPQGSHDWLRRIGLDNNWLDEAEDDSSPLTSVVTDTRTAQGQIYKACTCAEHQEIYSNWPTHNAELTIARCMKACTYCGKDFETTAELRKHMRKKYERKGVSIVVEKRNRWGATTPAWTRRRHTESPPRQPAARITRSQSVTDSTSETRLAWKSGDVVLASLFQNRRIAEYDIIAIQEPWRNHFINTSYHPLKTHFQLMYLDNPATRACLYINKRTSPSTWQVSYISADIISLTIRSPDNDKPIHIWNVYNEVGTATLSTLANALDGLGQDHESIVLGDFNLHHPLWSARHQRGVARSRAEELLTIVETFQLQLLTVPGTVTHRWKDGDSTIDLTFATEIWHRAQFTARLPSIWTVTQITFPWRWPSTGTFSKRHQRRNASGRK
ncbi:pol-like protein [Beauveria bassiana ARSEF 2860]|uniref:Pol-like protein n=1 Tax=Beauveria bassiana (strain ARSEF 2860) TaxID=655819 RepID=J4VR28_BEAB2|nr:pol-like protein [Beauveria bassiana ARSEF 2860]EJP61115.1 pol-like protein [Beauveria bassiana ARSEF 2860]